NRPHEAKLVLEKALFRSTYCPDRFPLDILLSSHKIQNSFCQRVVEASVNGKASSQDIARWVIGVNNLVRMPPILVGAVGTKCRDLVRMPVLNHQNDSKLGATRESLRKELHHCIRRCTGGNIVVFTTVASQQITDTLAY